MDRDQRTVILPITIFLCSFLLSIQTAFGQIERQPATHRTDFGPRSIKSILNSDGSIRRDTPGSYDAKGFRIWSGVEGSPRFTNPLETKTAVADACSDNWDDQFAANGLNGWVYAIAVASNGDVYVGGTFSQAGSIAANHIAKWDGIRWSALGSGTNDEVYTIEIEERSGLENAVYHDLYIGGAFTQAGGISANRIAKWSSEPLFGGWSALGTGMNGFVAAISLARVSGELVLYAGGDFTLAGSVFPANRVAKWNGTAWSALGAGVGSSLEEAVYALKTRSGGVLVGGKFSSAGGVARNNFAYWSGSAWTTSYYTQGINGVVEDIEYNDDV